MMTDKSQTWCFTLNNYTQEEYEAIQSIPCDYLIVGKEIGESGTPHLQGYIRKKTQIRFNSLKKIMPKAHIEIARGTPEQNIKYCSKDGDFIEIGERPKGQGKRSDLDQVRDILKETGKIRNVVQLATNCQQIRCAEVVVKYIEPQRNFKPFVKWFYGATGTGKSRQAHEEMPEAYFAMDNGKWWEGYDAHEDVIIDDMRQTFMSYSSFLRLLDRYPFRIECKGGSRQFLAKRIIITSPFHPKDIYDIGEDKQQLLRRIDEIVKFE